MNTLAELAERLETTGLPVTYRAWPAKEAPELPWIAYRSRGTNTLPADGGVYHTWDDVRVELYTTMKDPATEAKVEKALEGIHWEKTETYIDTERCYMITYEIEV